MELIRHLEEDETTMSLLPYFEVTGFERGLFSITFATFLVELCTKGCLLLLFNLDPIKINGKFTHLTVYFQFLHMLYNHKKQSWKQHTPPKQCQSCWK